MRDRTILKIAIIRAIANIIQSHPEEKFFQLLTQALGDSAEDVRSEAAVALGNLAYQPAVPQLIQLLDAPTSESRKSAALALMKIGDPTALPALRTAFTQASEVTLQQVLQLAISQLER